MAIVATEAGGLIPCPGGTYRTNDGLEAIKALSWAQVREIAGAFAALHPYDRAAVPGSILKIEDDNFDPGTGQQRQIHCFAISAKRYALFIYNDRGEPELLQKGVNSTADGWSEHGLGHLLNPTDPTAPIAIGPGKSGSTSSARPSDSRSRAPPGSIGQPSAASQFPVRSSQAINGSERRQAVWRAGQAVQLSALGAHRPERTSDRRRPRPLPPNRSVRIQPRKWERLTWIDQYSGRQWRGITFGGSGTRVAARLKTSGDVVGEYAYHPESKSADGSGAPCGLQTVGLLQRRHFAVGTLHHIGKESNRLEDVLDGAISDPSQVYTEYVDPNRNLLVAVLRSTSTREVARRTGLARSTIQNLRSGKREPRRRTLALLEATIATKV